MRHAVAAPMLARDNRLCIWFGFKGIGDISSDCSRFRAGADRLGFREFLSERLAGLCRFGASVLHALAEGAVRRRGVRAIYSQGAVYLNACDFHISGGCLLATLTDRIAGLTIWIRFTRLKRRFYRWPRKVSSGSSFGTL